MESFNQSVIKHKTGLPGLAAEPGNISSACRIMGFSRDSSCRCQAAREAGGVEALLEVSRGKPNLKNRVEEGTEQAVVEFATAFPAYGQVKTPITGADVPNDRVLPFLASQQMGGIRILAVLAIDRKP